MSVPLQHRYPGMWKRKMTQEERRHASEQIGYGYATISTNVQIVKASEVEEILAGNDEKFRASSLGFDAGSHLREERLPTAHMNSGSSRSAKKSSWIAQIPSSSVHLDAVPCASAISRCKTNAKRVKSFPSW